MKRFVAVFAMALLVLVITASAALAKGPAEKTEHNCMGFFVGGFPAANVTMELGIGPPGAVGLFVPANAPVFDFAHGDANCGNNNAGGNHLP
jgi:hypothetical protein